MKINPQNNQQLIKLTQNQETITPKNAEENNNQQNNLPIQQNDIVKLLSRLSQPLKQSLLQIWLNNNLPLNQESLEKLMKMLNNLSLVSDQNSTNQETVTHGTNSPSESVFISKINLIKAFAFILKNNLPLTQELINSLISNLNSEDSITQKSNQLPQALKNLLLLNTGVSPEQLTQDLSSYPDKLNQLFTLLNEDSGQDLNSLKNHLLGQKILNNQDTNLLLALEIPLLLPPEDKTVPLYLQIRREQAEVKQESKKKGNYKISFIISLENLGTIQADILYNRVRVDSSFKVESEKTRNLLKKNLPYLTERFQKLGITFSEPIIDDLDNSAAITDFLQTLLPVDNNTEKLNDIIHVDVRI